MEMPEFTTLYEKLGVLGTMLMAVLWFIWTNMRYEYGKTLTPDSLSKRIGDIQTDIAALNSKCDLIDRRLERVTEKASDYERWKERMILMWERHQERSFRRREEQRQDDDMMDDDMRGSR